MSELVEQMNYVKNVKEQKLKDKEVLNEIILNSLKTGPKTQTELMESARCSSHIIGNTLRRMVYAKKIIRTTIYRTVLYSLEELDGELLQTKAFHQYFDEEFYFKDWS